VREGQRHAENLESAPARHHVPQKIGLIVAAMLVLTHMKYPSNYAW
jgi:hypothetical protein